MTCTINHSLIGETVKWVIMYDQSLIDWRDGKVGDHDMYDQSLIDWRDGKVGDHVRSITH